MTPFLMYNVRSLTARYQLLYSNQGPHLHAGHREVPLPQNRKVVIKHPPILTKKHPSEGLYLAYQYPCPFISMQPPTPYPPTTPRFRTKLTNLVAVPLGSEPRGHLQGRRCQE
eukprot:755500-Hanusia_phi.AAC.3